MWCIYYHSTLDFEPTSSGSRLLRSDCSQEILLLFITFVWMVQLPLFGLSPRKICSLMHSDKKVIVDFFFSFSEKAASTSGKRLSNLDLPESNLPRWFQSSDHWMATHVPFLPQNGCAWDKYHLMPSSPPEFLRILSTNTHELHNRRGTNSWLTSLQPTRTLSHAKLCTWLQRQRPTPWRKEAKTG